MLLLDEPLAALDAITKSAIIDDLRAWNAAHGIPIIYVTHSLEEAFAVGEAVVVLEAEKSSRAETRWKSSMRRARRPSRNWRDSKTCSTPRSAQYTTIAAR